jgi:hypothetical protein
MLGWGTVRGQAIRVRPAKAKPMFSGSGTLSVAITPTSASFPLTVQGSNYAAFTVTTSWTGSTVGAINVYAYFSSPNALQTAGGAATIPSANVFAFSTTGGFAGAGYQPLTQNVPVTGSSVEFATQSSQALTTGSRTDNLFILIALFNPQQAAGTYTGTLYITAQEY